MRQGLRIGVLMLSVACGFLAPTIFPWQIAQGHGSGTPGNSQGPAVGLESEEIRWDSWMEPLRS